MATFTIVSAGKTPLGPGEINAGGPITVNPGDVFIFGPDVDADVDFFSSGGGPHDFDIVFNDTITEPSGINVSIKSDLTPTVTIGDNVDLGTVDIEALESESLTLTAGDGASLGKLDGSNGGNDLITLGNGFTATGDWNTTGGDDTIIGGDDVTLVNVKTGSNSDTITMGDRFTFNQIDTEGGGDTIFIDDDATGAKITGGSGDDTVRVGSRENITTIDGGSGGGDVYNRQDATSGSTNFSTVNTVCFVENTLILAGKGTRPVQSLRPGDLVWTRDRGLQPLRWAGAFDVDRAAQDDARLRPVRICAGALGPGLPARDLCVSQQHRVLLRSAIVARMFGVPEILVAAKKLVGAPGIDIRPPGPGFRYHHLLFDRHEVLNSEGAETESLLLAPQTLGLLARIGGGAPCALVSRLACSGPQRSARPVIMKRARIATLLTRTADHAAALQCRPAAPPTRPMTATGAVYAS